MDEKTRSAVDAAIEQAVALAGTGDDPFAVARVVAGRLPRSPLLVLAEAALVDQIRRAQRSTTLDAERRAQKRHEKRAFAESPEGQRLAAEQSEAESRIRTRHYERMNGIVQEFAASLRMTWTAELLGSSFALADGSSVTWGEATTEQHQERIDMFASNAAANLEGAARHQAALRDLEQAHAQTLNDLAFVNSVAS